MFYALEKDNGVRLALDKVPVERMPLALGVYTIHNTAQDSETLQHMG